MVNRNREVVGYRPFRAEPLLGEGLAALSYPGGEFLRKVSATMFGVADVAGERADREAKARGEREGRAAALAGRPQGSYPELPTSDPGMGGSSKPFKTNDPVAEDLPVHARAFLNAVAGGESGGQYNVRFTPRGGQHFDDLSKHPGIFEPGPHGRSSAAGRYQFTKTTWDAMGGGDFGPANQDRRAWTLAQRDYKARTGRNLDSDLQSGGLTNGIMQALTPTWQAFKGARGRHAATYDETLARLGGGAPAGVDATATASTEASTPDAAPAPGGRSDSVRLAGGTFRPTNSDTIYGRAYDEAGARTYTSMLDTEIRSTQGQLFDRFKDDPQGLSKGLEALRSSIMEEHVFDSIRPEVEAAFDSMGERYMSSARQNAIQKQERVDRAEFDQRTADLDTDIKRQMEAVDPSSPDAAASILSAQSAWDANFDGAVDRGILNPEEAGRMKREKRRETALGFYGRQAEALNADGVKSMREAMKKDFADGGIDGLDGDGWTQLDEGLAAIEKKKRGDQVREKVDFGKRGDAMAARIAAGFEVDQAELSKLMTESGKTPEGQEAMTETFAKISAARAIRDFSLKQGADHVAGLRKQYGKNPTDSQLRILQFTEGMLVKKQEAIAKDSVSYAEAQGIVPTTPMLTDAQNLGEIEGTMAQRIENAQQAAAELGTAPRYLKAGEARAIAAAVRANPELGASMAAGIVAGAGAQATAILAEFGNDAPMLAESGAILAFGGSAGAAEDVIRGYGKSADGKALKGLKPDAQRESFNRTVGTSLALAGRDSQRIDRAAAAIARTRIAEQGVEPDSDEAAEIHATAVQEAAGAVFDRGVQYGGFVAVNAGIFGGGNKVLIPTTMRADTFEQVIQSINDEDLATLARKPKMGIGWRTVGKGSTARIGKSMAATIRNAQPVAVSGGYAFAMGDPSSGDPQFVMGDDGNVFVLDINALRPRLAPRVPGAFR